MLPYLLLFTLPLLWHPKLPLPPNLRRGLPAAICLSLIVMIGLRFEVGCDWDMYFRLHEELRSTTFLNAVSEKGPGYAALSWSVGRIGGGVEWVNLICASILAVSLVRLSANQPEPWLALFIGIPILVVITGMSASRQTTAIAFLMLAMVAYSGKKCWAGTAFISAGVPFHYTLMPFLALPAVLRMPAPKGNWPLIILAAVILGGFVIAFALVPRLQVFHLLAGPSYGAIPRTLITGICAVLLLSMRDRYAGYNDYLILLWMTPLALALPFGAFISSTMVDRLGFYLLPYQISVLAKLPFLTKKPAQKFVTLFLCVAAFLIIPLWFWLSPYAVNCMLPYRNYVS